MNNEHRKDLSKFYKKVKTCKICNKEYGSDITERYDNNTCHSCWLKKYNSEENDYLCEHQDKKIKCKTVYKKGRGVKCYLQNKN